MMIKLDQIGTDLIALVNNNIESPNDYSATYDNITKKITFTSVQAIDSDVTKLWTATVNNGSVTAPDVGILFLEHHQLQQQVY